MLCIPFIGIAQNNALTINGGIITLSGNAVLTINNDNPNSIVRSGSGHIVSEAEGNIIHWNIGNRNGTYLLPFGEESNDYIPVFFTVNNPGSGPGYLEASTYSTPSNNLPWPAGVTHLNNNYSNNPNAANTNDRFWILNTSTYATVPGVTMTLTYRDQEYAAPNTIVEMELRAQRFNTNGNLWGDWSPPGQNINTGINRVTNIIVPSNQYYNVWALAGYSNPLPVELLSFKGNCIGEAIVLRWTTLSEIENDFFEIYKSNDGIDYEFLQKVNSKGNSNTLHSYEIKDIIQSSENVRYYRLFQTDMNGSTERLEDIVVSNCDQSNHTTFEILAVDENNVYLNAYCKDEESVGFQIVNALGVEIASRTTILENGYQTISIPLNRVSTGVYLLRAITSNSEHTERFFYR